MQYGDSRNRLTEAGGLAKIDVCETTLTLPEDQKSLVLGAKRL